MAAALRKVSVERGHDPRTAVLVAFGGAGGLHACALAESLGTSVLFPRHAGVLSALGALTGGSRRERSRTVLLDAGDARAIATAMRPLERAVVREFPAAARRKLRLERWAEMRYAGQSHELSVPLAGTATGPAPRELAERFQIEHERAYGFADPAGAVEIVTLEVRSSLPGETPPAPRAVSGAARIGSTRVWDEGGWHRAPVIDALRFPARLRVRGPALAIEPGATLWIPSGWNATRHASGALLVSRR
jgi:N-methylhydantoinase A